MSDASGFIMGFVLDGAGGGRPIASWDDVRSWREADGPMWLHLNRTKDDAVRWLRVESGVPVWIVEALIHPGTRPRWAQEDDGLLLILRGVNLNPGASIENMIALRMFIQRRRMVTLRARPLMVAKDMKRRLSEGRGPRSVPEMLTFVAGDLCERAGETIVGLEEQVDRLDAELDHTSRLGRVAGELAELRREATGLRRHLAPQRDALAGLAAERITWLEDADRLVLREVADRLMRRIEDLDAIREQAVVTQDELATRSSEELNRRLYLLAILTAVALPLTLITGLFGMEVGGLPFRDHPLGFGAVCLGVGLVTVAVLYGLKRLGWF